MTAKFRTVPKLLSESTRELWIATGNINRVNPASCVLNNYLLLDTTVRGHKSGPPHRIQDHVDDHYNRLFFPGYGSPQPWDIVLAHKAGKITDKQYEEYYEARMVKSYEDNTGEWVGMLRDAHRNERTVIVLCYCEAGKFCHRGLLKGYLLSTAAYHQVPVRDIGEWTT